MAYTRINYLKTIVDIQSIVMEYKTKGCMQKWVYDNVINIPGSGYHISYSTFKKYMTVNAKLELKRITE